MRVGITSQTLHDGHTTNTQSSLRLILHSLLPLQMRQGREEGVAHALQLREVRVLLLPLARRVLDVALRVDDEDLRLLHARALRLIISRQPHNVTLLVRRPIAEPAHERALLRREGVVNRP